MARQPRKYIMFRADWNEEKHDDLSMKLAHTEALTDILAEWFDSSARPVPDSGYRLPASKRDDNGTHYTRQGDWVVSRVEEYVPDLPLGTDFTAIIVCYCTYDPIEPVWHSQGLSIVSVDSFGGDFAAFEAWLTSTPDAIDRYQVIMPDRPNI